MHKDALASLPCWDAQGAIYWEGNVSIQATTFGSNVADYGGDINQDHQPVGTLTCPSACPVGATGSCSSIECSLFFSSDCATPCYSCDCTTTPSPSPPPSPPPTPSPTTAPPTHPPHAVALHAADARPDPNDQNDDRAETVRADRRDQARPRFRHLLHCQQQPAQTDR